MLKTLLAALETYGRWLERRRQAKRGQTEAQTRAVQSVLQAASDTRSYLYDLRQGGSQDRSRETDLARRWADAAVDVRTVDRRLSSLAVSSSVGWADPDIGDDAMYGRVEDQLELIQRQCEWLLEHPDGSGR
jgi:hypothetical protein